MSNPVFLVTSYALRIKGKEAAIKHLKKKYDGNIPSIEGYRNNPDEWKNEYRSYGFVLYKTEEGEGFLHGTNFYNLDCEEALDLIHNPDRYSFDGLLEDFWFEEAPEDVESEYESAIEEYGYSSDYDDEEEAEDLPDYCNYDSLEAYLFDNYGSTNTFMEIFYSNADEDFGQVYDECVYERLRDIYKKYPDEDMVFQEAQKKKTIDLLASFYVPSGRNKYAFKFIPHGGESLMPTEYDFNYANSVVDVFEAENDDMAILHVLQKYYGRYNDLRSEKTGRILKKKKDELDRSIARHFEYDIKKVMDWSSLFPRFLFLYNFTKKYYVADPRDFPFYYFEAKYEFDKK